jgi:hypothetical protein
MIGKTGGSGGWGALAGGRWVGGGCWCFAGGGVGLVVGGGGRVDPPLGEIFLKRKALINYFLKKLAASRIPE